MRKSEKYYLKLVAKVILFTFITTNLNFQLWNVKANANDERYILHEIVEKRTENEKYFLNSDGTETIRSYNEPIHYLEDNEYKDIDYLVSEDESGQSFETIANDLKITLPKEINDESEVIIESEENKSIEMIPFINPNLTTFSDNNDENEENEIVLEECISGEDSDEEDNKYAKLIYKYNDEIDVAYTPTKNGVKEEFILNSYPGINIFTTKVNLNGYKLKLVEEFNRIDILDAETNEIEGVMPQPFIFDSSEVRKETLDAKYIVEELEDNEYLISIEVNDEFLQSEDVNYPVYVDPTYTRILSKQNHASTYVMSGYPSLNFMGNNSMPVGYYNSVQGISRTHVIVDLPISADEMVISANYRIYSKGGDSSKGTGNFSIYSTNTTIGIDKITWNNKPQLLEKLTTKSLTSLAGEWVTFDMSKFVKQRRDGQANSFALVADNEGGTYRNFASEYYPGLEPYFELVVGKFNAAPSLAVTAGEMNSAKGSVNISWEKLNGVKGYKLGIHNGSYYEWIDVGNVNSYNTKGKGIWPTALEIQNGRRTIHLDGKGEDLSDNPSSLYKNTPNSQYKDSKNYYFVVKAYGNSGDESKDSPQASIQLPDRTKPLPVAALNGVVTNPPINNPSKGKIVLSWNNTLDKDVTKYKLEKRQAKLSDGKWSEYELLSNSISSTTSQYTLENLKDSYKYQFRITAYDAQGNFSDSVVSSELIVEDRTPPVSGYVNFQRYPSSKDMFEVEFKDLYDDSSIKSIEFRVGNGEYKSYPVDSRTVEVDLTGLPSKVHWVDYRFTDVFGNYYENAFEMRRDVEKPNIVLQPKNLLSGDYFTGVMAIDVVIEDSRSGILEWTLYYEDSNKKKTEIDYGNIDVRKTIAFDTSSLTNGNVYKLVLEGIDLAGNENKAEFIFIKGGNTENISKVFSINIPKEITDTKYLINYDSQSKGALYLYNNRTEEIVQHDKAKINGQALNLNSLNLQEGDSYYAYVSTIKDGKIGYSKGAYKSKLLYDDFNNLGNIKEVKNITNQSGTLKLINTKEAGYINLNSVNFDYYVDTIELNLKDTSNNSINSEVYLVNSETGNKELLINENGFYRLTKPAKNIQLSIVILSNGNNIVIDNIKIDAYGAFLDKAPGGELINVKLLDEPEIIKTKANLDYKTKVIWNPSSNQDVKYNVYRGKDKNFAVSDESKIASEITETSFSDFNLNYGETFYYKVTTVKEFDGVKRESIASTQEAFATVIDKNEVEKNIGKQDYYDFVGFSTADGIGSINVENGNLVYESTDVSIRSPLLDMVLRRTYNSLSTTTSAFGNNFDFSFNTVLLKEYSEDKETAMLLKDGDGTIHRFEKLDTGLYKRPKGIFLDVIFEKESGLYKVIRDDGVSYSFDDQLRLDRFIEKNGNFIELTYNLIGEIDTVKNNTGDSIIFTYNEKGLVEEIKTSSDISYKYLYDNSNRLIEVKTNIDNKEDENSLRSIKYNYGEEGKEFNIIDAKNQETKVIFDDLKSAKKVVYPNNEYFEYILNGNERIIRNYKGKEFKYILNESGLLVEEIDELGNSFRYEYNENYLVTKSSRDVNGKEVSIIYEYDDKGNITKSIDPLNVCSEIKYNIKGDPIEVRVPLISEDDISIAKIFYDQNRNVIKEINPLNEENAYIYNDNGQILSSIDIYGNETKYNYDSKGRFISKVDPLGRKVSEVHQYDKYGNSIETSGILGLKETKIYNSLGELTYFKDIDGYYENYYYDKNSNLELVVDSRSRETRYKYDELDRVVLVEYPDNSTVEYKYEYDEATGNEIDVTIDGDNIETRVFYDELGRVIKKTIGNIIVEENKYDENGNLVEAIDAEGKVTQAEYDILGRQTKVVVDPLGLKIQQEVVYDKQGKIESVKEPTGLIRKFEYDKLGRRIKDIEIIGVEEKTTSYIYGEKVDGKIRNVSIDALNRKKETYFDSVGRVEKEVSYGDKENTKKKQTIYTYNNFDDIDTITFQDGTTQVFKYNKYGEIEESKYSKKSGEVDTTSKFKYDMYGRLSETENTNQNVTARNSYSYDIMDKIIQKVQGNQLIKYEYSKGDRLNRLSYPEEENKDRLNNIDYIYDESGRLSELKFNGNLVNEYIYSDRNTLDKVKYYNKFDTGNTEFLEVDYNYNKAGLADLVTYKKNGTELKEKFTLSYEEGTGFINKEVLSEYYSGKENNVTKNYEYDLGGRLKKSFSDKGSITYEYNILGSKSKEIKEEIKDEKSINTTYDYKYGDFDRLESILKNSKEHIKYTYDELGNTLSQVENIEDTDGKKSTITTNYTYNVRNELIKVLVSDGKNSATTTNYYDVDGKRIKKNENGNETNYMYVGEAVLYTTDKNANKATENILDPSGGIVATKRFDGVYANKYFKYTYDSRGSIISILNPDLERVKGYGYDDFGNVSEVGDENFKNEVKYTGMIEDKSSGLHYMNARHYNPASGKFLNEDSYNDYLSPDLYSYSANNPINFIDPTGHGTVAASSAMLNIYKAIAGMGALASSAGALLSTPLVLTGVVVASLAVLGLSVAYYYSTRTIPQPQPSIHIPGPIIPSRVPQPPIPPFPGGPGGGGSGGGPGGSPGGGGFNWGNVIGGVATLAPVAEPFIEPLLNGIPRSQEIARVIEMVQNVYAKVAESAKRVAEESATKGAGDVESKPDSLTPTDAGRSGAFREAKRKSGIPVTKHPKKVTPARDRRGKRMPGRDYDFGDGKVIREHSGGHKFPDNPSQNRGPHFNDIFGNHFDF